MTLRHEETNPILKRSRRLRVVRARTVSLRATTNREIDAGRLLYPEPVVGRPKTRGECVDGIRPCPYAGCKYHLYLDAVGNKGSIKLNFPDLEIEQLVETCALDVADNGGETLEAVGDYMNMTRERVRQLEEMALRKAREFAQASGLAPGGEP